MANFRFVLICYSAPGVIASSNGYGVADDAKAAGIAAAPNGGYQVIDSWKMDMVKEDTTGGAFAVKNLRINESQSVNVLGQTSNLWPV